MKEVIVGIMLLGLTVTISSCKNIKDRKKAESRGQNIEDAYKIAPPPEPAPQIIKSPKVTYPASARRFGEKGKVAVKVLVDTTGNVLKAKVMWSTNKIFEVMAESLAYHYIFEPPIYNGKPQAVTFIIPIVFVPDSIEIEK